MLFTTQYNTNPDGKKAKKAVKMAEQAMELLESDLSCIKHDISL